MCALPTVTPTIGWTAMALGHMADRATGGTDATCSVLFASLPFFAPVIRGTDAQCCSTAAQQVPTERQYKGMAPNPRVAAIAQHLADDKQRADEPSAAPTRDTDDS